MRKEIRKLRMEKRERMLSERKIDKKKYKKKENELEGEKERVSGGGREGFLVRVECGKEGRNNHKAADVIPP